MKVAFKLFLICLFVGNTLTLPDLSSETITEDSEGSATSATENTEETTTTSDDSINVETTEAPTSVIDENFETEEVCTCCPVLPAILDESTKAETIKKQLKDDLAKVEQEFNTKKEELQGKIKYFNEGAEPLKEKLREVRKANRDKETELNIEEMSEKSLLLRKSFKELLDKVGELSESRFYAKKIYNSYKSECRVKKGDEDYDEDECRKSLANKLETIEKANADIFSTLDELKTKHNEIVAIENEIKVAEDELWTTIFENREKIETDVQRVSEIYAEIAAAKRDLENLGEKYEKDQRSLQSKARTELQKLSGAKFNWVGWTNTRKDVPHNSISGGFDLDHSVLYVIRYERDDGSYEYGKFSAERKQAYVTRGEDEKIVYDFDVSLK